MTVPYLCSTDPTEELLAALALSGKCDLLAMRMFLFPSHSLKQLGFLSETHRRSQFKICIFVYSYKDRVEQLLRHQRVSITSGGEAYASNAPRTARTTCTLGPWGTPVWEIA